MFVCLSGGVDCCYFCVIVCHRCVYVSKPVKWHMPSDVGICFSFIPGSQPSHRQVLGGQVPSVVARLTVCFVG